MAEFIKIGNEITVKPKLEGISYELINNKVYDLEYDRMQGRSYLKENGDLNMPKKLEDYELYTNGKVRFLVDESYTYEGITFYGTPWYNFKKGLKIVTIDIMTGDKRQEIIDEILLRLQTISNLTQTLEFSNQLSSLIQDYSEELRAEIPVKEDEVEWDTSGNFVTDTNIMEEDFIVDSNVFEETKTAA